MIIVLESIYFYDEDPRCSFRQLCNFQSILKYLSAVGKHENVIYLHPRHKNEYFKAKLADETGTYDTW